MIPEIQTRKQLIFQLKETLKPDNFTDKKISDFLRQNLKLVLNQTKDVELRNLFLLVITRLNKNYPESSPLCDELAKLCDHIYKATFFDLKADLQSRILRMTVSSDEKETALKRAAKSSREFNQSAKRAKQDRIKYDLAPLKRQGVATTSEAIDFASTNGIKRLNLTGYSSCLINDETLRPLNEFYPSAVGFYPFDMDFEKVVADLPLLEALVINGERITARVASKVNTLIHLTRLQWISTMHDNKFIRSIPPTDAEMTRFKASLLDLSQLANLEKLQIDDRNFGTIKLPSDSRKLQHLIFSVIHAVEIVYPESLPNLKKLEFKSARGIGIQYPFFLQTPLPPSLPALEELCLEWTITMPTFSINAPQLKKLEIIGNVQIGEFNFPQLKALVIRVNPLAKTINLMNAPSLESVSIYVCDNLTDFVSPQTLPSTPSILVTGCRSLNRMVLPETPAKIFISECPALEPSHIINLEHQQDTLEFC